MASAGKTTEQPEDHHEIHTAEKDEGGLRRGGRILFKTGTRITGLDVISKDIRRVRPLHPQLWKDIWNAPTLLKQRRESELNENPELLDISRARRNALLTCLAALAVTVYGAWLVSSHQNLENLPLLSKISMIALMGAGIIQMSVYGWISIRLTQKKLVTTSTNARPPKKPSGTQTTKSQKKRSKGDATGASASD